MRRIYNEFLVYDLVLCARPCEYFFVWLEVYTLYIRHICNANVYIFLRPRYNVKRVTKKNTHVFVSPLENISSWSEKKFRERRTNSPCRVYAYVSIYLTRGGQKKKRTSNVRSKLFVSERREVSVTVPPILLLWRVYMPRGNRETFCCDRLHMIHTVLRRTVCLADNVGFRNVKAPVFSGGLIFQLHISDVSTLQVHLTCSVSMILYNLLQNNILFKSKVD